ncbi:aldehyde dehydrogenase family protein [Streptomyces sp. NPDC102462]|uniref:aldehyde dehydrogenase family protein n=1 Tax=Streptomyces sp. NPDC102462 TaxID=3366178 RepID=UPI00380BC3DE
MITSSNPATGAELARYTPQSPQEVDGILDVAAAAQAAWRRRDTCDRTPVLQEMARILREGRDTYAALITAEMGKPISEARAEIEKSATTCEYYAEHAPYGLGAALWTSDLDRARRLARVLDAGAVFVNGMVASDPRLPFGGIKRSGYGREPGAEGIREFVNTKTVWIGPAV